MAPAVENALETRADAFSGSLYMRVSQPGAKKLAERFTARHHHPHY